MANDTKKMKPDSGARIRPDKTVKPPEDEDDEVLLAGGMAVLRAILRPRAPHRRKSR